MKTALVIPTLNAVKRGFWFNLLRAVAEQTIYLPSIIKLSTEQFDQLIKVFSRC